MGYGLGPYKEVINGFTGAHELGFRKYNLSNVQWSLLEGMLHVFKVRRRLLDLT